MLPAAVLCGIRLTNRIEDAEQSRHPCSPIKEQQYRSVSSGPLQATVPAWVINLIGSPDGGENPCHVLAVNRVTRDIRVKEPCQKEEKALRAY